MFTSQTKLITLGKVLLNFMNNLTLIKEGYFFRMLDSIVDKIKKQFNQLIINNVRLPPPSQAVTIQLYCAILLNIIQFRLINKGAYYGNCN